MKSLKNLAIGAALLASASVVSFAAMAKDLTVGVSWSNFQEERWKTDEAAIKKALEAHGAKYISADAQGSPTKQLTDVESLISKGAGVLIILAMDLRGDPSGRSRRRATKASRSSPTTA